MKINNNGKPFVVKYNSVEHEVPEGEMEVSNDSMARFIIAKANFWKKDVVKVSDTKKEEIAPIESTKKEVKVEEEIEATDLVEKEPVKQKKEKK